MNSYCKRFLWSLEHSCDDYSPAERWELLQHYLSCWPCHAKANLVVASATPMTEEELKQAWSMVEKDRILLSN